MFWTYKWLRGSISDLALRLYELIPKRVLNKRTVQDALSNRRWVSDIKGALTVVALIDYLHLWETLSDIVLQPNIEDKHIFSFASDGRYSAKVAYKSLFLGSSSFGHYRRVWSLGTHQNVNSSFGWLPKTGVGRRTDWLREV
jgi:hypothetical protein